MITIRSRDTTSTGGYTTGAALDMVIATAAAPNVLSSAYYPDNIVPPTNVLTPAFSDWNANDDIFDGFGYFCIYDTASQTYFFPAFDLNTTISTITFTFVGSTYKIVYGNRVTGYYTFHITQTSGNRSFRFCCWGNMGFDTQGSTFNYTTTLNNNSINKTYYYFFTQDNNHLTVEYFQIGCVAYDFNVTSKPFTVVTGIAPSVDNLSFYTNAVTNGVSVYLKKGNNTNYDWVAYDLIPHSLDVATSCDKKYADVNDEIFYTSSIVNSGVTVTSFIFKNTIPNGTIFITDSLTLNGVTQTGVNPSTGLTINTLSVSTSTITFKVKVTTIPASNPIQNSSYGTFSFTASSNYNDSFNTDVFAATTTINHVFLNAIETSSKNYSYVGDSITYTINLSNTGNTTANNVVFLNTLPSSTTFVTNSFKVNGVTQNGLNLNTTISIGTIPIGTTTLSFDVLVNTIPSPNTIYNSSNLTYAYSVDPSIPNSVLQSINTNILTTTISHAFLSSTKSCNKNYAYVGDTLDYTINLINTGNTTANNLTILDTIPTGSSFITNSLKINNLTITGGNPNAGYNFGTIPIGTTTINFSVTVSTIPSPNKISNAAKISYSFTADPSVPNAISNNINTNIVATTINHVYFNITKTANKTYSYVGDEVIYTAILSNTGNTSANNLIFLNTLPSEISFVTDSLKVNGITQTGLNPTSPLNIGTLPQSTTSTLTFKVTVLTIPSPSNINNFSSISYNVTVDPSIANGFSKSINSSVSVTTINHVFLNSNKYCDKNYASLNDTLKYTIALNNKGNTTANNVIILDTIPDGTSFVANSLTVNNITKTGANPNLGYNIGTLPLGITTVNFNVTVTTIPTTLKITNSAKISYSFTVDPSVPNGFSSNINTNISSTTLNYAKISGVKTVDKAYANTDNVLTYTIILTNTGITDANNIIITDTIPIGTSFIGNSITVNNISTSETPSYINIGNLSAGNKSTITFKVKVLL